VEIRGNQDSEGDEVRLHSRPEDQQRVGIIAG
jgi:hypothetical protein